MEQAFVSNYLVIVCIAKNYDNFVIFVIFIFAVCPIPDGVNGNISSVENEVIWEKGLNAYGETPSDLYGKRVDIPDYPVFLSLMVNGKVSKLILFKNQLIR